MVLFARHAGPYPVATVLAAATGVRMALDAVAHTSAAATRTAVAPSRTSGVPLAAAGYAVPELLDGIIRVRRAALVEALTVLTDAAAATRAW